MKLEPQRTQRIAEEKQIKIIFMQLQKSLKVHISVIPVQTGIQESQGVIKPPDTRFRGNDDFFGEASFFPYSMPACFNKTRPFLEKNFN